MKFMVLVLTMVRVVFEGGEEKNVSFTCHRCRNYFFIIFVILCKEVKASFS